ncbi:MAG: hypothetical protein KF905_12460 [Flavobacteriales bacterium]|nr:hypothetical protein [Flavobacteriales bacterium]
MFEYKPESTLHFVGIHAIHLEYESNCGALDLERTYHCIQGEFLYCGLLTDGQLLVSDEELDELLPLLELQVFKVEGKSLYVSSDEACTAVPLHVEHVSTEHFEDDDEEDEEMIFVARRKRGSIVAKVKNVSAEQRLSKHMLGRIDLGFA